MNICLKNKGITTLDFSSHDSNTAPAKEIIALQVIEAIDASRNKISSITQLKLFSSLQRLDLSHNRLTSPVALWLREMPPTLIELNLSHNEISSFTLQASNVESSAVPHTIADALLKYLPMLKRLNLAHNLLHSTSASLHGLEQQQQQQQPKSSSSPSSDLEALDLSNNTGLFAISGIVGSLPKLTSLHCEHNHIESLEGLALLPTLCPALKELFLVGCPVARNYRNDEFLWNLVGGESFDYESHQHKISAKKDVLKLVDHFFAALTSQVLPQLELVDGVNVVEARELVGPLLERKIDDVHSPQRETSLSDESGDDDLQQRGVDASTVRFRDPYADDDTMVSAMASALGATDRKGQKEVSVIEMESSSSSSSSSSEDHHRGTARKKETFSPPSSIEMTRTFESLMNNTTKSLRRQPPHHFHVAYDTQAGAPQHVLERLDYLHRRAEELQVFLTESKKNTRFFQVERLDMERDLQDSRRRVSHQRGELAALRIERDTQKDLVQKLQQMVRKRTLELDHAEVANIRVIEKRVESLVEKKEAILVKEGAKQRRDWLKQQSLNGAGAPSSAKKPTRTSIMLLEETQKRLRHLKETSPTAAYAKRFVYDEYGHPSFVGHSSDAERYPASARQPQRNGGSEVNSVPFMLSSVEGDSFIRRDSSNNKAAAPLQRLDVEDFPQEDTPLRDRDVLSEEIPHARRRPSTASHSPSQRNSGGQALKTDLSMQQFSTQAPPLPLSPKGRRHTTGDPSTVSSIELSALTRTRSAMSNTTSRDDRRNSSSLLWQRRVQPDHDTSLQTDATTATGAVTPEPPSTPPALASNNNTLAALSSLEVTNVNPSFDDYETQNHTFDTDPNSSLEEYRFPQEGRRVSSVVQSGPPSSPPFQGEVELLRQSAGGGHQTSSLIERRKSSNAAVAIAFLKDKIEERKSGDRTVPGLSSPTGHASSGQLSQPLTVLDLLPASEHDAADMISRLVIGDSLTAQKYQSQVEGGPREPSIQLQSPTKRMSETQFFGVDRRKPSEVILAEAAGEVMREQQRHTAKSTNSMRPLAAINRSSYNQPTTAAVGGGPPNSMSSVSRVTHRISSAASPHPYDVSRRGTWGTDSSTSDLSLDGSLSKAKPNFRAVE